MDRDLDYEKLESGLFEIEQLPADFTPGGRMADFGFSVLNRLGLLYRPVLDAYRQDRGGKRIEWPDQRPFAVCLTHDVDILSERHGRLLRKARSAVSSGRDRKGRRVGYLLRHGLSALSPSFRQCRDPLHRYENWIEAEKTVGARSTFFFWPGWSNVRKHHPSDCLYDLSDRVRFDGEICSVREMIREIRHRGWEIGLHASWHTCTDPDAMKFEKEALEQALGHEIVSARQHFLRYDIRRTPAVQESAGLLYDSTLGFNDNVGFRFGTCCPWRLHDFKSGQASSVLEIPLIVQDVALLRPDKGLRLDATTAFKYIVLLTEEVEGVGGVLTLLWHPDAVIDSARWQLYLRTLEFLSLRKPWFATIGEIGNHLQSAAARMA